MVVEQVSVNFVAVFIAAIAPMILGSLWYSPVLFGKMWTRLSKITDKDMKGAKEKGMGKLYLFAFIGSFVMSYILAHFVEYVNAVTIADALQLAFWLWLGFIATVMLGSILWEGKPVKLYLLNIIYQLASLALMSIILVLGQ